MNHRDLYGPIHPLARQTVHIVASTKLRFQNIIRNLLGPRRLAEINASINPFILPLIRYDLGLDVFIFVLY